MNVEDGIAPTSTPRLDARDADLRHRVDLHDWQAAIQTERTTTLLIFRHGHFMLEA
jgi:nucleoid-associated protein YejK